MSKSKDFRLDTQETSHVEKFDDESAVDQKVSKNGVILIPQPTDDPRDPLNWPIWRKIMNLLIVCLAGFAGLTFAVANISAFLPQAEEYGKPPLKMLYSISAALAGVTLGPVLWSPVSKVFGKTACIFWGMVLSLGCSIWAASMTSHDDYIPFIMAKLVGGFTSSVGTAVGSEVIVETFFLHQRGKAFTAYGIVDLTATMTTATFSGLIAFNASWPVQFWYNAGLEAVIIILVFLFLYETGYTRDGSEIYPDVPQSFVANRLQTLLCTKRVVPHRTPKQLVNFAATPFIIGLSPVTILCGLFQMIVFAWAVTTQELLTIYLQTPVKLGGYGFTLEQNAYFTFGGWVGMAVALTYGLLIQDRLPLYLCKRWGKGVWKPEYRLWSLWIPAFFLYPIGLGLFGAALEYHLHYMILAFAFFLAVTTTIMSAPPTINYISECFTHHATDATAILNFTDRDLGLLFPSSCPLGSQRWELVGCLG